MKLRRTFVILLCALLVAGLLAGCSSNMAAEDAFYEYSMDAGGTMENGQLSHSQSIAQPQQPLNQKLIRTLSMNAETEDLDTLLANIDQRIAQLEGYVEAREVYNGSTYSGSRSRHAELTVRVPVETMDQFVQQVSDVSNITSTNETTENVTLSYVATQSRMTALETEQTRLLELLAMAENMEDLLLIEQRLTEVRTELEEVTSQLRLYDNLVDYGTIHLYLQEVKQYTVVEEPESLWERIGSGFMESLWDLGKGLTELFVFVVTRLPYLIPVAVIGAVVLLIVKLSGKRRKKKQPPQNQMPQ